jgi:hypothetical protein
MTKLNSNTDLYNYLLSLSNLLADRGSPQLAESVRFAARQSTGLSTEFLGESRIALKAVLDKEKGILGLAERDELIGVVSQIDFALRR